MWVKICGNTSLADAMHAVKSGANALGFVFAPSPRRVNPEQARAITAKLPLNVDRYGVFVDASFEEIVQTVQDAGLNGVQLHQSPDPELPQRLRAHFGQSGAPFHIVAVVHFSADFEQRLEALERDAAIDAILVDCRSETAVGGTGRSFDWGAAREVFLERSGRVRLIVAGGLNPANVADAVARLEPWGVDVVSGVEASAGRKDPDRVEAFIQNAQRAMTRVL